MVRSKQNKQNADYKTCLKCEKTKRADNNFYKSNSSNHHDGRYPICKACIRSSLNITEETDFFNDDFLDIFQNTLLEMNRPFIYSLYSSTVEEHQRTHKEFFGLYIKNVLLNFQTLTWKESEFHQKRVAPDNNKSEIESNQVAEDDLSNSDNLEKINNRDREDVIRMLGYDPFIDESAEDRPRLYSNLVDFLDESTLEDGLKLQSVIEIVRAFNQVAKINLAISYITRDMDRLANSSGGMKSLVGSKKDVLASIMKLAEDNGISVKHNNQKSKGAGTLSGIIKQLQEKGLEEASVNLFDIETCEGMTQVADISNESIMKQLQFDENDYTQMILEQRELLEEKESRLLKLEEENRLLKKQLLSYKEGDIL